MSAVRFLAAGLLLSACVETRAPIVAPMTLPLADGRAQAVKVGLQSFVVNRQAKEAIGLRVTRVDGRDLDYSEGALAKKAAEAYCASYHRRLDPAAMGRFSLPNAWVFGGDCQ
jgi:hypothetical protein